MNSLTLRYFKAVAAIEGYPLAADTIHFFEAALDTSHKPRAKARPDTLNEHREPIECLRK